MRDSDRVEDIWQLEDEFQKHKLNNFRSHFNRICKQWLRRKQKDGNIVMNTAIYALTLFFF